jgi:hypothetical protein
MKKPSRDWKDTYRDALFQSPELRAHKSLLCLLDFIVHKTNSKLRACWVSQRAMAEVAGCKTRNIKKMLAALQGLGAIAQTRFSSLPPKDQASINAVAAKPLSKKSNVYYPCLGWAAETLEAAPAVVPEKPGVIRISQAARKRGSEKAADRRRRYAPKDLAHSPAAPSAPDHEDYLFLNAVGENRGPSSTPIFQVDRGPSSTRRLIENNPAANSAPDNGQMVGPSDTPSSQEIETQGDSSSLSLPPFQLWPSATGGGEPVTLRSKPAGFGLPEGARLEGTELGVAGARANERRAL